MTPIISPLLSSRNSLLPFDLSDTLKPLLETEKIERKFTDLKRDIETSYNVLSNIDTLYMRASKNLTLTMWLCLGSALLAAAGGLGAALCRRKDKKTRAVFALLAVAGASLSLLCTYVMYKMHASLTHLQPLIQRRWNL